MDVEEDAVARRLEETRRQIGNTVEALAYKTDVPARASDALHDGIAVAKENIALASDAAVVQTVEVASTIFDAVGTATDAATDVAAVAKRNVPSILRGQGVKIAIGVVVLAAVGLLLRRRKTPAAVVEEIAVLDESASIDESPEVEKARELLD